MKKRKSQMTALLAAETSAKSAPMTNEPRSRASRYGPACRFCMFEDFKGKGSPPMRYEAASFRIGAYEAAKARYRAATGASPSQFRGEELPVTQV
jgi:hypothetical protein